MPDHKSISEKIDELFQAHSSDRASELKDFLKALTDSFVACRKSESKNFLLLLLTWLAATLVSLGAVSEASLTSVKLSNVKLLALLAPPAMGLFGHNLIVAFVRAGSLWQAIRRCYKHHLPKAYELDLEDFTVPASFTDLGRASLAPLGGRLVNWWAQALGFAILLLPGALLIHVGYLLNFEASVPLWLRATSVVFGVAIWVHGLVLMWGNVTLSEG